jgi:hypothetical protein
LLDRRAKSLGFSQEKLAETHAQFFKNYLLSINGIADESQGDRVRLAANAMGFAEVIQRDAGPIDEIMSVAPKHLPLSFGLAIRIVKKYQPRPHLTVAESYDLAKSLLAFLDSETRQYSGAAPSAALRVVNPQIEPPLDEVKEAAIRAYIQSTQKSH